MQVWNTVERNDNITMVSAFASYVVEGSNRSERFIASQPFLSRKALGALLIVCILVFSRKRYGCPRPYANGSLQTNLLIPRIEPGLFETEP